MDLYSIRKSLSMGLSLTDLPLRVTFYTRVSTTHLKQTSSLLNQTEYFEHLIKENPNWTYLPGYIDNGISGTSDIKREQFMHMINDAKKNKFDLIMTKEISRFSRNTLDSIKYSRMLLNQGVAVYFLNDNINTALPDSELRLTIMASMAQDEIRRLSERVKFGMSLSQQQGHLLGNNLLYGYSKNKITETLVIIPKEAKIVKKIYTLYTIHNYSLNKIASFLNKQKVPTKLNKKWEVITIKRILTNPKYKGYYCGHKSEVIDYMSKKINKLPENEWISYKSTNTIPPIISEELWNKANQKLSKNTHYIAKNIYALSNKIYCQNDSSLYYPRYQTKNDITWLCSNYLKNKKQSCNTAILREKELRAIIKNIFKQINIDPNAIKNILYNLYNQKIPIPNQLIYDKLIKLLINKISVFNSKDEYLLTIYLTYPSPLNQTESYTFNRYPKNNSSKKYQIKYKVILKSVP